MKHQRKIVFQGEEAVAVILDIDEYQEMLERLEDLEDLQMLNELRQKPLTFKKLDDFLAEYQPNV
jgi:PHD/YefM family antitoxin component YafN of YafNO toxin-antitoxin module